MSLQSMEYSKEKKDQVNFLSKIFATFSQDIVKIWCENKNNKKFKYLLKEPTCLIAGSKKTTRLDHLLEDKGKIYIVEQKNFFGYQNGHLTKIDDTPDFIKRFDSWSKGKIRDQKSRAWEFFTQLNFSQKKVPKVTIKGTPHEINGKILIWSEATKEGKIKFQEKLKADEVLSIEDMISDLKKWKDTNYKDLLKQKQSWINELFSEVAG